LSVKNQNAEGYHRTSGKSERFMTPQRFQEIRGVFETLVSMSSSNQAAFLDDLRSRDSELAREVEALLVVHARRGSFIEAPAARLHEDDPFSVVPRPEKWIGCYHLIELIGEGGMGQVWRAEQTVPVRRIVAVKLIKAGMDTREVVSRFQSERQALALMEHQAIARVFDAGATPEGRPYFAMEYVDGVPITTYCDDQRLSIRDRLKLFVRVCEGVQHAHQKAIIHRDLKPSNVLVTAIDGKPVPKIIDFGLARAMSPDDPDTTALTRVGAILGTPDYMSPEQASLGPQDLDIRADVYSLGVILYELLSGALPLDLRGLSFAETLRRVAEADAPRPSTRVGMQPADSAAPRNRRSDSAALISQLRGDLDAIALKAIEKDRRRRYDSPADLAADLGRYLRNEPVTARPANAPYLVRKYVRRHRAGVAAAAVLLGLAVAFAIWQGVELRRITRERDRADRITQFMTGMFKVSDPSESRGNQITAREILDRASADMGAGLSRDPELQAQIMDTMGAVYDNLGLFKQAQGLLDRAVRIRRRILGSEDPRTAQSIANLANVLNADGHRTDGERLHREALGIRQRLLGPDHPDTLKSMNDLAWNLLMSGRYRESEQLYRTVLDQRRRVLGPEHPDTLTSLDRLGETLDAQVRFAEAEPLERKALDIKRKVLGLDHPETLRAMHHLANTLYNEGSLTEAERVARDLLEISKRVLGAHHSDTLTSMIVLANILEEQGRYAEAERLNRQALEIQRQVLAPDHPNALVAMNNIAEILAEEGRYAEAEAMHREVVASRIRVLGPEHRNTLYSVSKLAGVLIVRGKFDEAETLLRKTLAVQLRVLGADHPDTADTTYNLAGLAAHQRRLDEAVSDLRNAIDHGLRSARIRGMESDFTLKPLRGYPAFNELIAYARQRSAALSQTR
jgi:serine/threonine protein kinase/Tfp pilus assembly protein PilF